jgi:hypothetical protein
MLFADDVVLADEYVGVTRKLGLRAWGERLKSLKVLDSVELKPNKMLV